MFHIDEAEPVTTPKGSVLIVGERYESKRRRGPRSTKIRGIRRRRKRRKRITTTKRKKRRWKIVLRTRIMRESLHMQLVTVKE